MIMRGMRRKACFTQRGVDGTDDSPCLNYRTRAYSTKKKPPSGGFVDVII